MIAVIMEFATWLSSYLFSKRSKAVGKHRKGKVVIVPPTYHPMPELCGYPALWEARVSGRVDYLRVPLKMLNALVAIDIDITRMVKLCNYKWNDVPIAEWPLAWKVND